MTRVDNRDVVERAEDVARTAEFELQSGVHVIRCACGASVLRASAAAPGLACAGCGVPVRLRDRFGLDLPPERLGDWERGAAPETSEEVPLASCKGAEAPDGIRAS